MTATARVTVITRDGCHLCTEAIELVASVCAAQGVSWDTVDVDADPELRAQYTDHVPVTFVDGNQIAMWFLSADQLLAALERN